MKLVLFSIVGFILFSCSTELVDSWKNPEIPSYQPHKVLVIGMTSNVEARHQFETGLKEKLEMRASQAVSSQDFFSSMLLDETFSEYQMDNLEDTLLAEGFDTVLFTKVIGVEDKIRYKKEYDGDAETYKKFKDEYLMYQDLYYNPEYYEDYRLYHTETEMYCLCPAQARQLIWKGYIDITDPHNVKDIVDEYVKFLVFALEEEQLIGLIQPQIATDIEL